MQTCVTSSLGKGGRSTLLLQRSSVGSVTHDVGKRREVVAHFAVTFNTLPLPLVTLGEFGGNFKNNFHIFAWKSNSV
jgi:hypothetical protein